MLSMVHNEPMWLIVLQQETLFPLTLLLYIGAPRLYPINLEILYAIVYFAVDLSLTLSLSRSFSCSLYLCLDMAEKPP